MQSGIINQLYYNFVECTELSSRGQLLNDRIESTTKELKKRLNKNGKRKLEQIVNDYNEVSLMEVDNAFKDGFSFAVKLLSEAYSHK